MSTVEMSVIPELTPHRLNSRGERQPNQPVEPQQDQSSKNYREEAYRRMEYLGTYLHRRTAPSIQNIRDPSRDLQDGMQKF